MLGVVISSLINMPVCSHRLRDNQPLLYYLGIYIHSKLEEESSAFSTTSKRFEMKGAVSFKEGRNPSAINYGAEQLMKCIQGGTALTSGSVWRSMVELNFSYNTGMLALLCFSINS